MTNIDDLLNLAKEHCFTHAGTLDPDTLVLMPEVRDMCLANTCGQYDKNWSCPPGCGTLDECRQKVSGYHSGILVQTMGELEDSMDFETMMELEQRHKKNFMEFRCILAESFPRLLPLGAGACTLCKECTYPAKPCRFPEKSMSSMEAYGLLVTQICTDNGMKYYYGPDTLAYTSCFLLE